MKKILLFFITITLLLIVGCENTITLPELDGKSRAEIEEIMKEYDINYEFKFSDKMITSDDDLDKFVKYSGSYKGGSNFPLGNF